MAEVLGWLKDKEKELKKNYKYCLYDLIYSITLEIERILKEKGLSKKELAEQMGVSKSTISRILDGNRNMTLDTLVKLAYSLGYEVKVGFTEIEKLSVENMEECNIEEEKEYEDETFSAA